MRIFFYVLCVRVGFGDLNFLVLLGAWQGFGGMACAWRDGTLMTRIKRVYADFFCVWGCGVNRTQIVYKQGF